LSQPIFVRCVNNHEFFETTEKSVVTTDFLVRATDKSVRRTTFSRLDHKPNFPLGQKIIFFGVEAVIVSTFSLIFSILMWAQVENWVLSLCHLIGDSMTFAQWTFAWQSFARQTLARKNFARRT
jgi:hypothetical protein